MFLINYESVLQNFFNQRAENIRFKLNFFFLKFYLSKIFAYLIFFFIFINFNYTFELKFKSIISF